MNSYSSWTQLPFVLRPQDEKCAEAFPLSLNSVSHESINVLSYGLCCARLSNEFLMTEVPQYSILLFWGGGGGVWEICGPLKHGVQDFSCMDLTTLLSVCPVLYSMLEYTG